MTALDNARAHLTKAQEFLEAAELTNDLLLFNAAASNAVTSGINSKDAICVDATKSIDWAGRLLGTAQRVCGK